MVFCSILIETSESWSISYIHVTKPTFSTYAPIVRKSFGPEPIMKALYPTRKLCTTGPNRKRRFLKNPGMQCRTTKTLRQHIDARRQEDQYGEWTTDEMWKHAVTYDYSAASGNSSNV